MMRNLAAFSCSSIICFTMKDPHTGTQCKQCATTLGKGQHSMFEDMVTCWTALNVSVQPLILLLLCHCTGAEAYMQLDSAVTAAAA
jgi:hypothetical protein